MRFEWDDQKALENVAKHGVSFGEATEVFYDPNAIEIEDLEHSLAEARFAIIGYSNEPHIVRGFRRTSGELNSNHLSTTADAVGKEVV